MKNKRINEPAYLRGCFLTRFSLADVLFSRFCTPEEMYSIFCKYAEIFHIHNKEWLDGIWNVVSEDLFALADSASEFNRLSRLAKQYPEYITDTEVYVLSQKAPAILIKTDLLAGDDDASFDTLLHTVEQKAEGGDSDCLSLMGFMELEGVFFKKNKRSAAARIKRAASWNDLFALLMGATLSENTEYYYRKLYALFGSSSDPDTLDYLRGELDIPASTTPDKVAIALDQAFCNSVFHPTKMNHEVTKLMASTILSDSAKFRLIRSARKDERFTGELPLDITNATELSPDLSVFSEVCESRRPEFEKLISNLSMADMRATSEYKPLLIVSGDRMVLDFYKSCLRACFGSSKSATVTVGEGGCSLSGVSDNPIIAAMDKTHDRNTVIFLENCHRMTGEAAASLVKYLSAHGRTHHKCSGKSGVELDLSGTLPVLFADSLPDQSILSCCDVVLAHELNRDEFARALSDTLETKRSAFGLDSLTAEEQVFDFLFDYSSETVTRLINKAIGRLRADSPKVHLTVELLRAIADTQFNSNDKIGFWRNTAI